MGFLRFFKKKKLTNDAKIESFCAEVQGVFSQFKTMNEKLVEVNGKLQEVIDEETLAQEVEEERVKQILEDSSKRKQESLSRTERALKEMTAHTKLQEKIQEFII